jgi:hypothetical protein
MAQVRGRLLEVRGADGAAAWQTAGIALVPVRQRFVVGGVVRVQLDRTQELLACLVQLGRTGQLATRFEGREALPGGESGEVGNTERRGERRQRRQRGERRERYGRTLQFRLADVSAPPPAPAELEFVVVVVVGVAPAGGSDDSTA